MNTTFPDFKYPELTLWKTDIKDHERLQIINPGDFPRDEILNGLNIAHSPLAASFGICDGEEISHRLAMMRLLIEHQGLVGFINAGMPFDLPWDETNFLRFFDPLKPHNPYWQSVHDFLSLLSSAGTLPARLLALKKELEISLRLEDAEKEMAQIMAEKIEKIAVIEGLVDFRLLIKRLSDSGEEVSDSRPGKARPVLEALSSETHGHRMYSSSLSRAGRKEHPGWLKDKKYPLNWIGYGKFIQKRIDLANAREKKQAMRQMIVTKASEFMLADIARGTKAILSRIQWETVQGQVSGARVHVYYSYSNDGLKLHIYGMTMPVGEPTDGFSFGQYEGYPPSKLMLIQKSFERYRSTAWRHKEAMKSAALQGQIEGQLPGIFTGKFPVASPEFDREHRWFAITNLYSSPELVSTYWAVQRHRAFLKQQIATLKEVAALAERFIKKSHQLGVPICYPEIVSNGKNLVAFDEVLPIHLLSRPRADGSTAHIIPIRRLPALNGQMIGLTGAHGGGKTVTELSVVSNIYLAQSGLPSFGRNFRLNIKRILGLVFIERGEGSTCELLLAKIKNVLEGIRGIEGGDVVLVLDEIGTGTQEASGLELGRDLLSRLAKQKVSVLFSTQITDLAKFAVEQLGADCFQVDDAHALAPGIGTGGMDRLRRRMGLNQLLK